MTDSIATDSEEARAVATALRKHPAVLDAAVHPGPGDEGPVAWLVPDPEEAAVLHRAVAVEAEGRLGPLGWHEPSDGLRVAGVNRSETDFLYREIFAENAYFQHGIALPPGAVVVDVGANIGMFTLSAAMRSPGARIIACEPVGELADAVAVNAELHGADVAVLRCGLGRAETDTEFTYYPHNSVMSGSFAEAEEDLAVLRGYMLTGDGAEDGAQLDRLVADRLSGERRRVPVTTLSRIAADQELKRIDLLKIDVEKAEEEVLAGIGAELWPRIDRVVLEVHDVDGRLQALVGLLRAKGFTVTHEQDPRLALTPCHNVYAHRPGTKAADAGAVPAPGRTTLRVLERELRDILTRYAPSAGHPERFALTPDLARVPAAGTGQAGRPDASATRRTDVLAGIWAGLFGADSIRQDADFFDLGGDSLTAVRLLTQVEEELGEEALTPDLIFTDSTFGALAAAIEASAPSGT